MTDDNDKILRFVVRFVSVLSALVFLNYLLGWLFGRGIGIGIY